MNVSFIDSRSWYEILRFFEENEGNEHILNNLQQAGKPCPVNPAQRYQCGSHQRPMQHFAIPDLIRLGSYLGHFFRGVIIQKVEHVWKKQHKTQLTDGLTELQKGEPLISTHSQPLNIARSIPNWLTSPWQIHGSIMDPRSMKGRFLRQKKGKDFIISCWKTSFCHLLNINQMIVKCMFC